MNLSGPPATELKFGHGTEKRKFILIVSIRTSVCISRAHLWNKARTLNDCSWYHKCIIKDPD